MPPRRSTSSSTPSTTATTPRRSTRRSVTRSMSVESRTADEDERGEEEDSRAESSSSGSTTAMRKGRVSSSTTRARKSNARATPVMEPVSETEDSVVEQEEEEEESEAETIAPITKGRHVESSSEAEEEEEEEQEIAAVTEASKDSLPAKPKQDRNIRRILLRRRVFAFLSSLGPIIRPLLIFASLALLFLLPSPTAPFSKNTYVDENALQPGQANVAWDWADVALSDENSRLVQEVAGESAKVRADFLVERLRLVGLQAHTQEYEFDGIASGVNTYARWSSGRTDGREAVIIAASWLSRWDGSDDPFADEGSINSTTTGARRTNVRGISITLALAKYLTHQMHWSKDLIFVFSDGYMEGMQAWSNAYFTVEQSNLVAQSLVGGTTGATIWNAIAIDYPSDSFSSLVLLHEGMDGQLPNMDVLNTVVRIAERLGHIAVRLPGTERLGDFSREDETDGGGWGAVGTWLEKRAGWGWRGVARYKRNARNIAQQMKGQALCEPSGLHGLFQRFHVDAITVSATPARGPYGFWQLGRVLEATLRSFSNLLERLHHSQFFYLLTGVDKFVQLGVYLPVAILLGVALTLGGISIWLKEGARAQERKIAWVRVVQGQLDGSGATTDVPLETPTHLDLEMDLALAVQSLGLSTGEAQVRLLQYIRILEAQARPVISALVLVGLCHAVGAILFLHVVSETSINSTLTNVAYATCATPVILTIAAALLSRRKTTNDDKIPHSRTRQVLTLAHILHAFTMLEAGLIVAVLSVLNFSIATVVGILLVIPLYTLRIPQTGVSVRVGADDKQVNLPWVANPTVLTRLLCAVGAVVIVIGLLPWNVIALAQYVGYTHPRLLDGVNALLLDWHILRTAFLPILFGLYTPLVLQVGTCALLPVFAGRD